MLYIYIYIYVTRYVMRGAGGGSCSPCPVPQVWRKPPGVGIADDERHRDTEMMVLMRMSCREDQADDGAFMNEDGRMLCLLVSRR